MTSRTIHLRSERRDVADVLLRSYRFATGDPGGRWDPERFTKHVMGELDRLVAKNADLDGDPRLHAGASDAQRLTVNEITKNGISDKRLKMLRMVSYHDGITCDELEVRYDLPHSSASARLNWLERQGLVERDRDRKYKTRAGGSANPYEITFAGTRVLEALS